MQRQLQRSKKVRWSDSVKLYNYTDCENPQIEIIAIRGVERAHSTQPWRLTFLCEEDAIISQRRTKRNQHTSHFEKILPKLAELQWSHLSLLEMESVELDIITELDSLRQTDALAIGPLQHSRNYYAKEKQLSLLLEAYECIFKLSCTNHVGSVKQRRMDKDESYIDCRRLFRLAWCIPLKKCVSLNVDTDAESG
jgi:hypothetical protein